MLKKHWGDKSAWVRVDDQNSDGGNTSFCVEDVLLCVRFSVIWKNKKPLMLYEISYGTTLLSWFEMPIGPATLLSSDDVWDGLRGHIASL
jgi:hypothetical protein